MGKFFDALERVEQTLQPIADARAASKARLAGVAISAVQNESEHSHPSAAHQPPWSTTGNETSRRLSQEQVEIASDAALLAAEIVIDEALRRIGQQPDDLS